MFLLMPRKKKVTKGNKKDGKAEIASGVISLGDKLAALISILTEDPVGQRGQLVILAQRDCKVGSVKHTEEG